MSTFRHDLSTNASRIYAGVQNRLPHRYLGVPPPRKKRAHRDRRLTTRFYLPLAACLLVALTAIAPTPTFAAQRMVFAPGVYTIAANGTQPVPAFCLDFIEHAPGSATTFGNAFASFADAFVKIGDQSYALPDAVNQNLVTIHGAITHYTTASLMSSGDSMGLLMATRDYLVELRKDQRRHLIDLMAEWNSLSEAQKTELSAALDRHIVQSGDFSRLAIKNNTSLPIALTVHNAHVAEGNEPIANLNVAHLPARVSHSDAQYTIWIQRMLQDTSYYNGPITGVPTDQLKSAVRAFQARHPEALDASLTEGLDALRTANENVEALRRANTRRSVPYVSVLVETAAPGSSYSRYRASAGSSVLYQGDSVPAMMKAVNAFKTDSGRSDIFIIGTGLPTHDQAIAFRTSLESAQNGIDRSTDLHIATTDSDTPIEPLFDAPTASGVNGRIVKATTQGDIEVVGDGAYHGWFVQKMKLWYENGASAVVYVAAATRELLATAVLHVVDAVAVMRVGATNSLVGSSPDTIVAFALHSMKAGGAVSRDDVAHKVRMNVGGIQISLGNQAGLIGA